MYFHNRQQAGRMLASRLVEKFRFENCTVVALDDGGVVIGAEIAKKLHCGLAVMVSESIDLPREQWAVGGITADGEFVTNSQYSKADLDELQEENRGYIEEQRINKFHDINKLLRSGDLVDRRILNGHHVIIASEGLSNMFKLDLALAFMKTLRYESLIVATPLASLNVVDWLHVHADEIYCLSVVEEYTDTNHYYDVQDIPDNNMVTQILGANILNWE